MSDSSISFVSIFNHNLTDRIDALATVLERHPVTLASSCTFGCTAAVPDNGNDVILNWCRRNRRNDPGEFVSLLGPGAYTLAVSVGRRNGTAEIALPDAVPFRLQVADTTKGKMSGKMHQSETETSLRFSHDYVRIFRHELNANVPKLAAVHQLQLADAERRAADVIGRL